MARFITVLIVIVLFSLIPGINCDRPLDKTKCLEDIKTFVNNGTISRYDQSIFLFPPGDLTNPTLRVSACKIFCGSGLEVKQDCAGRVKEVRIFCPGANVLRGRKHRLNETVDVAGSSSSRRTGVNGCLDSSVVGSDVVFLRSG